MNRPTRTEGDLSDDEINMLVGQVFSPGEEFELPDDWAEALKSRTEWFESPSSITAYLACPLRWYLERYSQLPSGSPGFPSVLGTFVHRVLEVFYSEPAHLRSEKLLDRTFRAAWDSLVQHSTSGIIPPDLQEEFDTMIGFAENPDLERGRFYKKARVTIENVLEFDGDPSELNIISTETWVRMTRGNITVRGKIDRIEEGDGGEIIQDFKSGRLPDENEKVDVLSPSYVPLGLYILMRTVGSDPYGRDTHHVSGAQLLFLAHRARYNIKVRPSTIKKVSTLLDRTLDDMRYHVAAGTVLAKPAPDPEAGACYWCPAKAICPAWKDGSFEPMREQLGI